MGSGRIDRVQVAEAALWELLGEAGAWWWARLSVGALGELVRLLAALAPLALGARDAGVTAAAVTAAALGVTVAARVEVGAAHLLGEDVDHVLLLAGVWARSGEALQEATTSLGLRFGVLGLSWVLLEDSSVDLALEELVGAGGDWVLGGPARLQLGPVVPSLGLLLRLSGDEELTRSDSLAHAAHLASLMEELEAWALSSLSYLSEDLLRADWRLLWRGPVLASAIEGTVRHVVLASHSEDAAG
jgi:hypothetical protein